jgi:hypothetical protein
MCFYHFFVIKQLIFVCNLGTSIHFKNPRLIFIQIQILTTEKFDFYFSLFLAISMLNIISLAVSQKIKLEYDIC